MTSISGFSKLDLYKELEKSLLSCPHHIQNIEYATNIFVELALSSQEIINLVSFSIDFYAQRIIHKSVGMQYLFTKQCLFLVDHYKNIPFGNKVEDKNFQKHVAYLIMVLIIEVKGDAQKEINNWLRKSKKNDLYLEYVSEYINTDKIFLRYASFFGEKLNGFITDKMYRLMCVMLFCIRNKDYKIVQSILHDLLWKNDDQYYVCSFLGKEDFKIDKPVIKDPLYINSSVCNDIFWVIWVGLLTFSKKYYPYLYKYIYNTYLICQINMKKKNKKDRICLLLQCFQTIVSQDHNENNEIPLHKSRFMQKAADKIHVFFDEKKEYLENEKEEKETHKKKEKADKKEQEQKEKEQEQEQEKDSSSLYSMKSLSFLSSSDSHNSHKSHNDKKEDWSKERKKEKEKEDDLKKKKKKKTKTRTKKAKKKTDISSSSSSSSSLPDYLNVLTLKKN